MAIIEDLKSQIKALEAQIKEVQDQCSHPKGVLKAKNASNTGNPYERDSYWIDYHCQLCDKRWTVYDTD